ncbi:hypothetical protein AMECASPLE_020793 [Ameca splendens]|uniref:Uncharacterized protein n=1 Tax=Ameca splendens TaxID=208324 RepID=A0ABV0ZN61_9TELE
MEKTNSDQRCPSPSCVSMKSDKSMDYPLELKQSGQERCPSPSCMSFKSDKSRDYPLEFKHSDQRRCLSPSCMSLKSDKSKDYPLEFKESDQEKCDKSRDYPLEFKHSDQRRCHSPSCVSIKSNKSRDYPLEFKQSYQQTEYLNVPKTNLDSIFKVLEDSIFAFIRNELKNFHQFLQQEYKETCLSQEKDADEQRSSKDAFLSIIVQFLRRMKHEEVAYFLLNSPIKRQCEVKEQAHQHRNDRLSVEHDNERVHQKPSTAFNTREINFSSVFKILEEDILNFAKNELKIFHKILSQDDPESFESQEVEVVTFGTEEEELNIKEAFLKITLEFMRDMKQEELGHALLNKPGRGGSRLSRDTQTSLSPDTSSSSSGGSPRRSQASQET